MQVVFVELSGWSGNSRVVYARNSMHWAGVCVCVCVMGRSMCVCVGASCVVPYSDLPLKCMESPLAVEV